MARSIEQIYQEILLAKDAEPSLRNELTVRSDRRNAASRTAIWQLWAYVFAVVGHSFERLWDLFRQDITNIIESRRLGTPDWYVTVSREFQYSEEKDIRFEILPEGLPGFTVLDPNATETSEGLDPDSPILPRVQNDPEEDDLIIRRASFREANTDSILLLKVATENEEGLPIQLSSNQLSSFANYIDRIKFAGTQIQIVSQRADRMVYDANVYFNTTQDRGSLEEAFEEAVRTYADNIPFDGFFVLNDLIKQVRLVDGIDDVVFRSITFARFVSENLEDEENPNFTEPEEVSTNRNYETGAGYIELQEDASTVTLISVSDRILRQPTQ